MLVFAQIEKRRPFVLPSINIVASLFVAGCVMASNCHGGTPVVRGGARDAVNAAWLLASLNYDPIRAQTIPSPPLGKSRESTFEEIKNLGNSMGVKTDLRSLKYSDLCMLSDPCVVLLRHSPQATGYFAVVLHAEPGQVITINAGWLTVAVLSEDEFRLRWSGYALVPQRDGHIPYAYAVSLFILGFMISQVLLPGLRLLQRFVSVRPSDRPRTDIRDAHRN